MTHCYKYDTLRQNDIGLLVFYWRDFITLMYILWPYYINGRLSKAYFFLLLILETINR